jgi:hypothetical protein
MSNGEVRFRVSITGVQRELLRRWDARGVELGIAPSIGQILGTVQGLLQFQPLQWGEPYSTSPALRLRLYRGHRDGLLVFYGVDTARHIVYVSEFRLVPWHPILRAGS